MCQPCHMYGIFVVILFLLTLKSGNRLCCVLDTLYYTVAKGRYQNDTNFFFFLRGKKLTINGLSDSFKSRIYVEGVMQTSVLISVSASL